MPVARLKKFLDANDVAYETIPHEQTFTAQQTAESAHLPGHTVAKTVIVKLDGRMGMAVIPADEKVALDRLGEQTGATETELATEQEFAAMFPECELGAMPPFGNLYGMEVFVGKRLAEDPVIAFNAGTHDEVVKITYDDFERLVAPRVIALSTVD